MKTENNPKISIIVPVYNVEKFLAECLDSILSQSFEDFEVLLVNDASEDGSRDICERYASQDARIRILDNEKNLGQSMSRNYGMREARGDYVTFIDSDDLVDSNYLMKLLSVAEQEHAEVVSMGYAEYICQNEKYYKGRQINIVKGMGIIVEDRKKRMDFMCNWGMILVPWGKLYRKDFLQRHKLHFEKIVSEDILFSFAVLYAADKYLLLPDNLYYYRQNPDSTTRGGNIDKLRKALESAVRMHRFVNLYLKRMPDIEADKEMVKKIHDFFTEALWTYLFFQIAKDVPESEIFEMADGVFKELMPGDSEFVGYLFRKFYSERK